MIQNKKRFVLAKNDNTDYTKVDYVIMDNVKFIRQGAILESLQFNKKWRKEMGFDK